MKFLVDAQLPPALAQWLHQAGHEAKSVRELGLRDAEDAVIWRLAEADEFVIVTKDEDFARLVQGTESGPNVLWLRMGNTSNAALRTGLLSQLVTLVNLFDQGNRLVEVR